MNSKDKLWIKSMYIFDKYWGCHQIPDRSFFIKGYQLPVCARCTGMIIGYILAIIFIIIKLEISIIISLILMLPLVLDGGIQYISKKYISNNIKRFITGVLYGIGFIYTIFNLIIAIF